MGIRSGVSVPSLGVFLAWLPVALSAQASDAPPPVIDVHLHAPMSPGPVEDYAPDLRSHLAVIDSLTWTTSRKISNRGVCKHSERSRHSSWVSDLRIRPSNPISPSPPNTICPSSSTWVQLPLLRKTKDPQM